MGMFDTIYFDKAYTCPKGQGKIYSTQTKAFENLLEGFHVKDCVGHAEEMRIVKEELFCDNCSESIGKDVYIYYPEDMSQGEESWSVDVYQDEVNERCRLNWTWTVISKKELEAEGEKEEEQPEWEEVVDEPFSEEVVCKAIEKWLRGRGYEFGVRMIPLEQARGSGLIKRLRERGEELESGEAVSMEVMERELKEEENKRLADFIAARGDKRKVFYYDGLYGSLVADVESDRLVGKIEGIDEDIVYAGNTIRECEQRFREAVSRYR